MTAYSKAIDLHSLRIGVISPNLASGLDWPPESEHNDAVVSLGGGDS